MPDVVEALITVTRSPQEAEGVLNWSWPIKGIDSCERPLAV